MEQRFYICEHCGNIIAMVKDSGVPVMCCAQKMTEIIPGTSDGAVEKHLPEWKVASQLPHHSALSKKCFMVLTDVYQSLENSIT